MLVNLWSQRVIIYLQLRSFLSEFNFYDQNIVKTLFRNAEYIRCCVLVFIWQPHFSLPVEYSGRM